MGWINTTDFQEPEEKPKAVLAIDFDGTIVENDYPSIGKPNDGAIEVLRELLAKKYRLILLTMRHGESLQQALVYCNVNNIDFWGVNENPDQHKWSESRKVYASLYIDDTGLGTPLKKGSNGKPCVDWVKVRQMLVDWEVLDPVEPNTDGVKRFDIR